MEIDLTPKLAKKVYGGEGGSYHSWAPSELPMLREGNIGAAKLSLEKNGFAIPRYSDSSKVAYVLQGVIFFYFVFPKVYLILAVFLGLLLGFVCFVFLIVDLVQ